MEDADENIINVMIMALAITAMFFAAVFTLGCLGWRRGMAKFPMAIIAIIFTIAAGFLFFLYWGQLPERHMFFFLAILIFIVLAVFCFLNLLLGRNETKESGEGNQRSLPRMSAGRRKHVEVDKAAASAS